MTRRQMYFIKQKLIGLLICIIGIVILMFVRHEISIISLVLIPIGVMFMFTREMVWMDYYYYEMERRGRLD